MSMVTMPLPIKEQYVAQHATLAYRNAWPLNTRCGGQYNQCWVSTRVAGVVKAAGTSRQPRVAAKNVINNGRRSRQWSQQVITTVISSATVIVARLNVINNNAAANHNNKCQ